ncbi:MAG: M20/M25/M40 family metallo-hydrolase [Planctomycetota bacterium]|nr:M20/M25/M40 family metallo-hydrolase [Planctomycetota bacterium]
MKRFLIHWGLWSQQAFVVLAALAIGWVDDKVDAQDFSNAPAITEDAISIADRINEKGLHGNLRFLADDLLEGRGPGSKGDLIAQLYLESQFQRMGLAPLPSIQSYRQPFPMLGLTSSPSKTWKIAAADKSGEPAVFQFFKDYIAVAGQPKAKIEINNAEIVFVGYGIQAPEYQWDDFKGKDLKGKILLMMNNDPESDPKLFAGARRLYYGRWDYKYESAARQGAAGAIIIHTTPSAGYPFKVIETSWTGEQFELQDSSGPRMNMKAWMTNEATAKLVERAGMNLDALRAKAESKDFQPVPLGLNLSTTIDCEIREKSTANVLAVLPGSDSKLANEFVLFMAHHDHIGIAVDRDERGDNIYNGAIDNASGTAAMLAIAQAIAEGGIRPKRSLVFAAVGAEEQGLLGSKYFAEHPPIPNGKQSAVVNIDGINFIGATRDVNVIGFGKSSLDRLVDTVAKYQNRIVVPDTEPSKGYYYRSDQFSLAKVGVPGVYLHSGNVVIGKPEGWGKEQLDAWTEKHYHQRSDEYDPNWDLSGAVVDVRLLFHVGWMAANADEMQSWSAGDEFEAARKNAIQSSQR